MRLLDTKTGRLVEAHNPHEVKYAILSHTWDPNGEQTYQEVLRIQNDNPEGSILSRLSPKVRHFCELARANGYKYGWVDSCCIDKTSSAELSEAINSMYAWYRDADVCYAYLHDVSGSSDAWVQQFRASRWHKRGWTLQELIAPKDVSLLSREWTLLGSKSTLASLMEEITGVDRAVLAFGKNLSDVSVAHRMAWAASRETTREEDRAYSLFGIFDVQLPILYGEGMGKAFFRLQEEIVRQHGDQSIIAWKLLPLPPSDTLTFPSRFKRRRRPSDAESAPTIPVFVATREHHLLASSPSDFTGSTDLVPLSDTAFRDRLGRVVEPDSYMDCSVYGLQARLPIVRVASTGPHKTTHIALLACEDPSRGLVGLLLRKNPDRVTDNFTIGAPISTSPSVRLHSHKDMYARATYITNEQMVALQSSVALAVFRDGWVAAVILLVFGVIIDIILLVVLRLTDLLQRKAISQTYMIASIAIGAAGILVGAWLLSGARNLTAYRNARGSEHFAFYLVRQFPAASLIPVIVTPVYVMDAMVGTQAEGTSILVVIMTILIVLMASALLIVSLRRGRVHFSSMVPDNG